jgi:hypothetical protein
LPKFILKVSDVSAPFTIFKKQAPSGVGIDIAVPLFCAVPFL